MFITNRTLNALDALFNAAEIIEGFDAVALGDRVINATATIAAVIVGVITYAITALQLFWCEHGETILTRIVQFTVIFIDACGTVYYWGVNSRPVINRYCARLADSAFYALTA